MEARFDGNSELVAELVTLNGFKSAYAIKDGAEGPQGWQVFIFHIYYNSNSKIFYLRQYTHITYSGILQNSGLPWIEPKKALSLDFGSLTDTINDAIGVCILDLCICDCNIQC